MSNVWPAIRFAAASPGSNTSVSAKAVHKPSIEHAQEDEEHGMRHGEADNAGWAEVADARNPFVDEG